MKPMGARLQGPSWKPPSSPASVLRPPLVTSLPLRQKSGPLQALDPSAKHRAGPDEEASANISSIITWGKGGDPQQLL